MRNARLPIAGVTPVKWPRRPPAECDVASLVVLDNHEWAGNEIGDRKLQLYLVGKEPSHAIFLFQVKHYMKNEMYNTVATLARRWHVSNVIYLVDE